MVLFVMLNVVLLCVDVGLVLMMCDGKCMFKVIDLMGFLNAGLESTTTFTRFCCASNAYCG